MATTHNETRSEVKDEASNMYTQAQSWTRVNHLEKVGGEATDGGTVSWWVVLLKCHSVMSINCRHVCGPLMLIEPCPVVGL
jgi:Fe-S cluster assembly scaffold protein SufB